MKDEYKISIYLNKDNGTKEWSAEENATWAFFATVAFIMFTTWIILDVVDAYVYPLYFIHDVSDICYGDHYQSYCSKETKVKYQSAIDTAFFVQLLFSFVASGLIWLILWNKSKK